MAYAKVIRAESLQKHVESNNGWTDYFAVRNEAVEKRGRRVEGEQSQSTPVAPPTQARRKETRARRRYKTPFTPAEFWKRVDVRGPQDCWLWQGTTIPRNGYGTFWHADLKQMVTAHRGAYLITHGAIPDGLEVMHSCDVRLCQNPAHLKLGTHLENMQDMQAKGRRGMRSPLAHSPKGRPWSAEQRAKIVAARRLRAAKQIEARSQRSGRAESA